MQFFAEYAAHFFTHDWVASYFELGIEDKAKACVVISIDKEAAERNLATPRIIDPTATAQNMIIDTICAAIRTSRINNVTTDIVSKPITTQLPNIAAHIINTQLIW